MPTKKEDQKIEAVKVAKPAKTASVKKNELSISVYTLAGAESGTMDLPKEVFGQEINLSLLSQAMRVYTNNLKSHYGDVKTRGEVVGSTRKIYKQKGTGGARHGAKSAPIFVKGGIAMGPKYRKTVLELPKKMKSKALVSALSQKAKSGEVIAISDLAKTSGKTAQVVKFVKKLNLKSALIISGKVEENAKRAIRNIPGFDYMDSININAFEVLKHNNLILTHDAVDALKQRFLKEAK